MNHQSESQLQEQICNYLSMICRKYKFIYFSVPNEAWGAGRSKKKLSGAEYGKINHFKKMGMTSGVSDLIIGHKGKMFCLELKLPKGKQSESQIIFMNNCKTAGVEYGIVRSLDECKSCLEFWGITE